MGEDAKVRLMASDYSFTDIGYGPRRRRVELLTSALPSPGPAKLYTQHDGRAAETHGRGNRAARRECEWQRPRAPLDIPDR